MMRPYGWRFNIRWNGTGGGDGGDGTGGDGGDGTGGSGASAGSGAGGIGSDAAAAAPGSGNAADAAPGQGGIGSDAAASRGGGAPAGQGGIGSDAAASAPGTGGDPGGGQGAPAGQGGIGSDVGAVAHGADPFGGLVGVSQNPSSLGSLAAALANSIYGKMPSPPGTIGSPFGFTADPVSALDHAVQTALQGMNPFGTSLSPGVPGQTMGYPSQTPSIGVLGQPQATPAPAPNAVDPGLFGSPAADSGVAPGRRGIGSDAVAGGTAGQTNFGPPGPGFGPTGLDNAPPGVNPASIAAAQNPFGGLTGNLGFGNTRGVGDPGAPGSSAVGTPPANQAPGTIGPEAAPTDVTTAPPATDATPTAVSQQDAQSLADTVPGLTPNQKAQVASLVMRGMPLATAVQTVTQQNGHNQNSLMNALVSALQGSPALSSLAQALGYG